MSFVENKLQELKCCPKCGGFGIGVRKISRQGRFGKNTPKMLYTVECRNVKCKFRIRWFPTAAEAKSAWNVDTFCVC